jgi:dihydroorotate dehydrogenase electron transfer subunit
MKSVGPSPKDVEARICWTVELAEKTYLTRLEADHVAQALPGQFLQLCVRADFSPLLRLPLSVCAADPATGTVDVAYEDVGPKTHILSRLPSGSQVGCMGPLGNYFPDPDRILDSARLPDTNKGAVLLVGGGVGMPPLLFYGSRVLSRDPQAEVCLLAGARTAAKHFPDAVMAGSASRYRRATDDGTSGHAGLVTDLLKEELAKAAAVTVYTCGPVGMMAAVATICRDSQVPCLASLEEYMACGFGVCVGCVVELAAQAQVPGQDHTPYTRYSRVCVDGPVYDTSQIQWA